MIWNSQAAGGAGAPMPSLNGLWAFEAVARHGSFTRAAAELSVTQTAVSHQVRRLEEEIGVSLFDRRGQRVLLTAEGQRWAADLGPLFARLREVNQRLRGPGRPLQPAVAVSVLPSLGSRLLVPRLSQFRARCPDLRVQISATERLVDLELEPIDVAVRYGSGKYPGLWSVRLCWDAFVPVATPRFLERYRVRGLADLGALPLLHDDHPSGWGGWVAHAGAELGVEARPMELTESAMMVEACLRDQGIALARFSLVMDDLRSGALCRLFPEVPPLPTGIAYYAVTSRRAIGRPAVASFIAWLMELGRDLSEFGDALAKGVGGSSRPRAGGAGARWAPAPAGRRPRTRDSEGPSRAGAPPTAAPSGRAPRSAR